MKGDTNAHTPPPRVVEDPMPEMGNQSSSTAKT